jgi:hypothetical protein
MALEIGTSMTTDHQTPGNSTDITSGGNGSRWLTIVQASLLGVAAILIVALVTVMFTRSQKAQASRTDAARRARMAAGSQDAGFRQGPGGFGRGGFGGVREETRLVARFDRNGDSRLDTAERAAAREALVTEGRGLAFRPKFGGRSFAPTAPGPRLAQADVRMYSGARLYDPSVLRTIFLEFEASDWEAELEAFYNSDVDVPSTVTVDRQVHKDVGVHFRGASSFVMVPRGSKRSLNLSFDFVHASQALGGYATLNLLNVNGDPSFLRTVLYAQIARAYIPAPQANYARVVINGESWGVYVNAQQFNKDFVRDNFGTTKGARWKVPGSPGGRAGLNYLGDDAADYRRLYEIKSKDDPASWADLIRLCRILNETPPAKLEAALDPILNIDGALRFLALDVALVNTDGYWARASDYSIYQDVKGRFHIIPHDINEGMVDDGGRSRGGPPASVDLDPLAALDDPNKALRARLLAVPSLRARYLAYVRDIAETWLDWKKIGPLAEQFHALVAADVRADTRKLYTTQAFDAALDDSAESLKTFIRQRRAYLLSYRIN